MLLYYNTFVIFVSFVEKTYVPTAEFRSNLIVAVRLLSFTVNSW